MVFAPAETPQHQHQIPGVQEHISDPEVAAHLFVLAHTGLGKVEGEGSQNLGEVVDIHTALAGHHIVGPGDVVAVVVVVMNIFQVMGVGIGPDLEEDIDFVAGAGEPQLIVPGDSLFQRRYISYQY